MTANNSHAQVTRANAHAPGEVADYVDFAEVAAPATPASGFVRLYPKTDGLLYSKDDAGTETLVSGGSGSGSGLTFTPINRVTVLNSTTASSIARTLTAAITEIPADAVAAVGYLDGSTNGAINAGNYMAVYHTSGGTSDVATLFRFAFGSGVAFAVPFTAGVVQSTGSKLSYEIGRAANTITYALYVTGYWAPA